MSGPTSLQRAAPSCCQKHRSSSHHYHYRRQCHRHRHRRNVVYHSSNGDITDERVNKRQLTPLRSNSWNEARQETTRVSFERENDENLRETRGDPGLNDEQTKERIFMQHEKIDEPPFYGKTHPRTCVQINYGNSKRPRDVRPLVDINHHDSHKRIKVRNDDDRFSWQFHFSDVLTRRSRRDDTTPRRRNGGQRSFASNIFLLATAGAFLALAIVAPPVSGTSSEKHEASRPRMGGTGTGTTLPSPPPNVRAERVPVVDTRTSSTSSTISGADITGSIDLLAALQLYNTTRTGVTQVPGLDRLRPAYYLEDKERDLRLNEASFERAAALLRRVPDFTVAAALRQDKANSGTIVAFSHGNDRYLELQSSGRKDELRLHYVSRRDGAVHMETFPFRLADGAWHRVALSISGPQVELLVDCHPLYRRFLRPGPPDTNFTLPKLQLWVGQRNAKHSVFKGALQDVKLIPGPHGYLSQCPQLDSSCPTCGQFSILQNTVELLMHDLNELTQRLAAAEGRISRVEECECQKSCRANGTVHEDGATWEKDCEQCSCVHGVIECKPTQCAPVNCKYPIIPQGQCCPVCLKQCLLHGVIYDHGEKVSPKQCRECNCFDGVFTCQRFDTETICPPLPCPASEQISVAEECCKFCPGVDYCAKGHKCHANASCLNLQTKYACHCHNGFQGDGHNCNDVDECQQQGGLDGHHCNANTRCVNIVGAYTCECLPGYHRIDKFNCAELDECATGRHSCSEHATCINTAGSYYCVCNEGYSGDGYTCKPVCEQSCQNGGECASPGRCSCRRGYIGNSCELDLDECASDLHRCHHSSTCFNMPGWYYCRCKPGYRSALHESNQGTQCLDIDECNDQTIERRHTCHPTARCVNTEGGYECTCPAQEDEPRSSNVGSSLRNASTQQAECRLSCWYEGREVSNGDIFVPSGNPCRRCECKDGVVTCREPECDCSAAGSPNDKCCPQCDPTASCRHQELHHLVFRSGERWIYQCQTCECLNREIDCWQMECPPVTCPNPITEDGDCCPRCEDDPCARELPSLPGASGNSSSAHLSSSGNPQPCSYAGFMHESGSSWQDLHDKCTTCECKDGQLCCSYDYRCAGDLEDKRDSALASGKSRTSDLSSGMHTVGQIIDSSEGALSTGWREYPNTPLNVISSRSGVAGSQGLRYSEDDVSRRRNGFEDVNSEITTNPSGGFTSEISLLRNSRFSSDMPSSSDLHVDVVSSGSVEGSESGEHGRKSRRGSPESPQRRNSDSGVPSRVSQSSTTTKSPSSLASRAATPTKSTTSKKTTPIGRTAATAADQAAAKSLRAFNKNIQPPRYSTSRNLNERKTSFASDRRRRTERGPRLINGNPSGHDAT
ncbi:protein kinase C-binding protein NELL1-like isoform X2 [Venturia canescens]|uniref:protein kinase C-binding protein NELL1-like isoform X2 n=1 Tax=Venturia canescens TaxID=32260 RepID=UPI001C9D4736|nr:protein kinase C-binding protein NELL1-like isoform X2 [Venturia canescens]